MNLKELQLIWYKAFLEPASPAPVCVLRILIGFFMFQSACLLSADLLDLFGAHSVVSFETAKMYGGLPRFSLLFFMPENDLSPILLNIFLAILSILICIGCFTKVSLISALILLVSLHHRNCAVLNSGDTLLRAVTFLLIFAPCHKMFSLDALLFKRKYPDKVPDSIWDIKSSPWVQRLIQYTVAVVYFQNFWGKYSCDVWWQGTAVYYALRLEELQKFPIPFTDNIYVVKFLSYFALFIEFLLWSFVWIKEFRYYILGLGCLLHLGIDYSMNIPLFEYIMISTYIVFVDAKDIRFLFDKFQSICRSFKTNI